MEFPAAWLPTRKKRSELLETQISKKVAEFLQGKTSFFGQFAYNLL